MPAPPHHQRIKRTRRTLREIPHRLTNATPPPHPHITRNPGMRLWNPPPNQQTPNASTPETPR